MEKQYVEQRDEGYWVASTRVSLDSVVLAFQQGLSPETIASECFPTLTLEQVYGAITFFLANRSELDAYVRKSEAQTEAGREAQRASAPDFSRKMARARRELLSAAE